MKVRIGFGLGGRIGLEEQSFTGVVDELERIGYDSLWVSERANSPTLDPMVAMTWAAARTRKLKVGASVMVLPGRNPVLLAKAIASLDVLSNGRALPAFGLGIANSVEHQAFGIRREERAPWFDEALPLMRRLWDADEATVTHHGERFQLDDVAIAPKPIQQPIEVWLGGASDAQLRRVGRLSDGWLPSFTTPAGAQRGKVVVDDAAARDGRQIDPEHFGVLIPYLDGDLPDAVQELVRARQPDADPADIVARSPAGAAELMERFVAVGFSKFVLHPFAAPSDWTELLESVADAVFPLQT
ncbi:MAG: LLM class flavin-dependent oxidoreductase [Acidimicrobiia bacterium]|nr:LLM class flavin-dependent oxidoreductase [Acidimicrobiia bacterium]